MASVPLEKSRSVFRKAVEADGYHGMPDEELLDRFIGQDGAEAEAAFHSLVRRHGPMVLGVCRHILGQLSDAEDAFQATFLVLARKAGSIRDRRVLGRWLYEVAHRIAVRSKTLDARRRSHERQGAEMSAVVPGTRNDQAWSELKPVLHEEVGRLPEKYRTAVVLCYLEGRTNEEAAALLQWPVGTVKGRLSRAREILRKRLTRRGLTLSAAFLLVCLSRNTVFAEVVPSRLADITVRAALQATRGGDFAASSISERVAELAEDPATGPWGRSVSSREVTAVGLAVVVVAALLLNLFNALSQPGGVVVTPVLAVKAPAVVRDAPHAAPPTTLGVAPAAAPQAPACHAR